MPPSARPIVRLGILAARFPLEPADKLDRKLCSSAEVRDCFRVDYPPHAGRFVGMNGMRPFICL